MTQQATFQDRLLINQLREIILRDERQYLSEASDILETPSKLKQRIHQPFDELFTDRWEREQSALDARMVKLTDQRILAQRDAIMTMLTPMIGELVKRFVIMQMQLLQQRMEEQIHAMLNQGFIGRLRHAIFGVKQSKITSALAEVGLGNVEEVMVLEKHSGLLLGSASRKELIDSDLVGGMLTAIKSFVEDAFLEKPQDLDLIQYSKYSIAMHDCQNYFVAVVMDGPITPQKRSDLEDQVHKFAQRITPIIYQRDFSLNYKIREQIKKFFW